MTPAIAFLKMGMNESRNHESRRSLVNYVIGGRGTIFTGNWVCAASRETGSALRSASLRMLREVFQKSFRECFASEGREPALMR
jgi:hypothetical protein